jgi:hypothetical protein
VLNFFLNFYILLVWDRTLLTQSILFEIFNTFTENTEYTCGVGPCIFRSNAEYNRLICSVNILCVTTAFLLSKFNVTKAPHLCLAFLTYFIALGAEICRLTGSLCSLCKSYQRLNQLTCRTFCTNIYHLRPPHIHNVQFPMAINNRRTCGGKIMTT